MGFDDDLRNGTLTLARSVEEAWLRDRLPRSVIRACSELVRFEREQSAARKVQTFSVLISPRLQVSPREHKV
jgi:hypothetical protein